MIYVLVDGDDTYSAASVMAIIEKSIALLATLSILLAYLLLVAYLDTDLAPRFPTAILSMGLMLFVFLSLSYGLILDTITRGRLELKRLVYLSISAQLGNS